MELTIYQVDAFAPAVFQGNPAAVVPLEEWLPDPILQKIAAENNLSETAYFVKRGDHYHLRWFTPAMEVRLCGHATLASAHVLFHHLGVEVEKLVFETLGGQLVVAKAAVGYAMDFPTDYPKPYELSQAIQAATSGLNILNCALGTDDILVQIDSAETLWAFQPDPTLVAKIAGRGLILTAKGVDTDIASRCFYPNFGINEDPVTGSAHTLLTPYWAAVLGKTFISAVQGGPRRGYLHCSLNGERVSLSGQAQTYLVGKIWV